MISILPTPRPARPVALTLSHEQFERLTVVCQIKRAFKPGARLAAFLGVWLGGIVPLATWWLIHFEVARQWRLWALVAGGLLYSAPTVYAWIRAAYGSVVKAVGFVVLMEGLMTFAQTLWLSIAGLVILVFINAVFSACALQVRKEEV